MSTDATPSVEAIARNPLVGVDGERCEHHFDRYRDIVYVLDPDGETVEHVESLQPGELPGWVKYVADERGWNDCAYVDGNGIETLAEELVAHMEAGR